MGVNLLQNVKTKIMLRNYYQIILIQEPFNFELDELIIIRILKRLKIKYRSVQAAATQCLQG